MQSLSIHSDWSLSEIPSPYVRVLHHCNRSIVLCCQTCLLLLGCYFLTFQSHINISSWFAWLNMAAVKPGHIINNHGFACLWLQKRCYGTVGLFIVVGGVFLALKKKKCSPLDRSNSSHNLLLLWSVCYQGRHICRGERKAEKCLFLHHPWQQVSMHFIFVNAFFILHKSLRLWP